VLWIFKGRQAPLRTPQEMPVQLSHVQCKLLVWFAFSINFGLLNDGLKLIVLISGINEELTIFLRRLQVVQILPDDLLYLQWVEVLHIGKYITHALFGVFQLPELDKKHVIQSFEVQ